MTPARRGVRVQENAVSTPTAPPPAPKPAAKPGPAAVIRRAGGVEETLSDRLVNRHLPAWVVSGLVHLGVIALLWLVFGFNREAATAPPQPIISASAEAEKEDPVQDLTIEDPGFDSAFEAALPDLDRVAEKTVDAIVADDVIGTPDAKAADSAAYQQVGLPSTDMSLAGTTGTDGSMVSGTGGVNGAISGQLLGRSGATKSKLLKEGGGNADTERAVARGLSWLAKQQKPDGSWVYDGTRKEETIAATGMALLPFLAAGQTQKTGTYAKTVARGLDYLGRMQSSNGKFNVPSDHYMYSHGIATTALCEAYGMTRDQSIRSKAQAAVNYIVAGQAVDGSWGYNVPQAGDTSIVGWEVQALKAARLSKDIIVPEKTFANAIKFLDKVSVGSRKSAYGYSGPNGGPGTALTAVGLLCRHYLSGWDASNGGMSEGVDGLMKAGPRKQKFDMYYYYYATQVVHFFGGDTWKSWNEGADVAGKRSGGMRDWLMELQKKDGPASGSWDPDADSIGKNCGRLGTTCLSLLTLEVYYRHLPLYKRENRPDAVENK